MLNFSNAYLTNVKKELYDSIFNKNFVISNVKHTEIDFNHIEKYCNYIKKDLFKNANSTYLKTLINSDLKPLISESKNKLYLNLFKILNITDSKICSDFIAFVINPRKREATPEHWWRESLDLRLNDVEYVDVLVQTYFAHVKTPLTKPKKFSSTLTIQDARCVEVLHQISTWIMQHSAYLSFGEKSVNACLEGIAIPETALYGTVRSCLLTFFNTITAYDRAKQSAHPQPRTLQKRVSIITEKNGGAHLAQAKAMRGFLTEKGYQVQVLNRDDVSEPDDIFVKAGIRFTDGSLIRWAEIYNRIAVQQENELLASQLLKFRDFLKASDPERYRPDANRLLLDRLREFQPHLIIHNLPYQAEALEFLSGRLQRPVQIIHCDYDFHGRCANVFKRQRSMFSEQKDRLIHFGIPVHDKESFPGIPDAAAEEINVIGYPNRAAFRSIHDPEELLRLRVKHGFQSDSLVYFVQRGLMGATSHLVDCVKDLLNSKEASPCFMDIAIVCGENEDAAKKLMEMTKEYPKPDKQMKFHIYGRVSGEVMNEFYNLARICDGKAGGGSTAEFLATLSHSPEKKGIFVPEYFWEVPNARYIESRGFGRMIGRKDPKRPDRMELVKELMELPAVLPDVVDWKKALIESIESYGLQPVHDGGAACSSSSS